MGMMPFTAPPSAALGMMPEQMPPDPDMMLQIDPRRLIEMLTEMEPDFAPKYPAWFDKKKVKKPKPGEIWAEGRKRESKFSDMVNAMADTERRLRFEIAGIFPRDERAREDGEQDPFVSSALVDDYNLLCAILASFDMGVQKKVLNRAQRTGAQTLEDFWKLIREEEIYRWANTGDMPLQMVEAKILACYGRIWSRHMCNLDDPDYPFEDMLIDPKSVYWDSAGTHGLKRVYRMMRMSVSQAFGEWGEPTKANREKLHNRTGRDDDTSIITVCEYADEWYRAATIMDGIELLPVTEHRYGYVPFIMQGGPAGEPLFTDTARSSRQPGGVGWWQSGPSDDWGNKWKLTSSISAQTARHDQLEAVMARITTSIADSANPALIVYRDNIAGATALQRVSRKPGDVTEFGMGDKVEQVPAQVPPMDLNQFMQVVGQDKMTGSIPLGMYGQQTGSQQTGNSMSVASESGMDHITPWVMALEQYHTRKATMKIMHWRNFGHLTRFSGGEEKPFLVPVDKPTNAQELARELTPQLIDAIGPRVNVSLTRIRPQELLMLSQIAQGALPLGLTTRRRMAEKMGETDYDRMREEWQEEVEWETMQGDEQMRRLIKIPMNLKQWAEQATNPEEKAMYMALLDYWMEQQAMAMQAQAQPQMPPMGGPPGGAPPMGMPPGIPQGGPGSNIMNQAANPMTAPGADGAPVGRPPIF